VIGGAAAGGRDRPHEVGGGPLAFDPGELPLDERGSSPLAARLQAARALGFQAVVVGSVDGAPGNYRVVTEVHRLGTLDAPGRSEVQAADPWDAVDQVAASVRAILAVPGDRRVAPDPPLKSVSTESADALRDYGAAARALGLDGDAARAAITDPARLEAVAAQDADARRQGISGVPFLIFNQRLALSGAQPPEVMLDALRQSLAAAPPSP